MSARRRPSSPSWVANIPRRRARASPSESGSTPTMAPIWSALPWRMTLIIKSVPMFPDPMIATFNCRIYLSFQRVVVPAARSCCSAEANADGADIGDFGFVLLILLPSDHRPQCSGQYDIARSKRLTSAGQLPDQPEGGLQRMTEAGRSRSDRDDTTVPGHHHAAGQQIDVAELADGVAQHKARAGAIVCDGIDDADLPVGDAAIDDLEGRRHESDGAHQLCHRGIGPFQVPVQHKRDFSLDPRLDQPGGFDLTAVLGLHLAEQRAEIGFTDAELLLDGNRRETNLATHETRACCDPATGEFGLDLISGLDVATAEIGDDRRYLLAIRFRLLQLVGDPDDGLCVGQFRLVFRHRWSPGQRCFQVFNGLLDRRRSVGRPCSSPPQP